jgi:uncharacterized protein (TIGR02246 family)
MTTGCPLGVALLLAISGSAASVTADQARDEAEIRDVQARQAQTWNRHDAKAYAALFAEDADVVNVAGWRWKGRRQLEERMAAAFAFAFRESTLTVSDVDVRFLAPGVAIAHVRWTMVGARMPPGMPEPRQGIQSLTMTKESGGWRIAAFQNTLAVPEVPFPPGPPRPPSPASRP